MLTSGIIGLPMVGKTTIFNLMTLSHTEVSNFYSGKVASNVGMAKVPDLRMDKLQMSQDWFLVQVREKGQVTNS